MLGRQLEYQSLKTVLLHMDANVRFQISLHMPSIRSVEKIVPLKVNYLQMDDHTTYINDTTYRLGMIRHYPDGNTPEPIKWFNNIGGYHRDYDKFGFADVSGDKVWLPGDVSLKRDDWVPLQTNDTEEDERRYRDQLRTLERALETLNELKSKEETVDDYLKSLETIPNDEFTDERNKTKDVLYYSPDNLRSRIESTNRDLLPFDCRRYNRKPPFTCYIQFIIETGESRLIQRFEYTKKIYEAAKHLNGFLFGSRTMPIQLRNLDLNNNFNGIVRLPVGFRMQVNTADLYYNRVTNKSLPSIVENWESLNSLWIYSFMDHSIAPQSTIVRNAKQLVIEDTDAKYLQTLVADIRDLTNLEIWVFPEKEEMNFLPCDYFQLIFAWLNEERRVGSCFGIGMEDEETAKRVVQLVRTHYACTDRTERFLTAITKNSAEMEVYYAVSLVEQDSENINILKMRIIKTG